MKETLSIACLGLALAGLLAVGIMNPSAPHATTASADSTGVVFTPAVADTYRGMIFLYVALFTPASIWIMRK